MPTDREDAEEMSRDIERIEELRYRISVKTYDSLRNKRGGKAQTAAEIDRQIGDMRKEFENKNSRLRQAGIDYLIVNKRQLNDLREKFMGLNPEKRDNALESIGEGAELIENMNGILQKNFDKKTEIAKLIISFSSLSGEKSRVREAIEGDQEFAVAELKGDASALANFFDAAKELGFICKNNKGKILICGPEEKKETSEESNGSMETFFVMDIPGMQKNERQDETDREIKYKEKKEIKPAELQQTSRPASQIQSRALQNQQSQQNQQNQQNQIPELAYSERVDLSILERAHETDLNDSEKREKEIREKARLNVAEMERGEVEERMKKILTNIKMQRWVLGTFKNQEEKDEYNKAQILLTTLMKRKRELDGKR